MKIFILTTLILGGFITFIGWYFGYKHNETTREFLKEFLKI